MLFAQLHSAIWHFCCTSYVDVVNTYTVQAYGDVLECRSGAARVAGSLLNAVGLPELVTETERDYEALILELATNPTKLAKIKEKLATNLLTQPLFNTKLYTKHLENGYLQAYKRYIQGNLPQTIIVPK